MHCASAMRCASADVSVQLGHYVQVARRRHFREMPETTSNQAASALAKQNYM